MAPLMQWARFVSLSLALVSCQLNPYLLSVRLSLAHFQLERETRVSIYNLQFLREKDEFSKMGQTKFNGSVVLLHLISLTLSSERDRILLYQFNTLGGHTINFLKDYISRGSILNCLTGNRGLDLISTSLSCVLWKTIHRSISIGSHLTSICIHSCSCSRGCLREGETRLLGCRRHDPCHRRG